MAIGIGESTNGVKTIISNRFHSESRRKKLLTDSAILVIRPNCVFHYLPGNVFSILSPIRSLCTVMHDGPYIDMGSWSQQGATKHCQMYRQLGGSSLCKSQ